jgi:predicted dienelactone hydrolase
MLLPLHRRALLGRACLGSLAPLVPGGGALAADRPADLLADWHDPARARTVPVRIRFPASAAPAPVVIISHGLGGSRDGLAYLGAGLANAGFIAVHLQHHGTDAAVWQGAESVPMAMAAAVLDVRNALDRLLDVQVALATLPGIAALRGRLDATRIAIAGHSYGAWTVLHMLGERLPGGDWGLDLPDPRLRAGIALSPFPPIGMSPIGAYARITAPILHITGTEDRGFIEAATPADRTIPYHDIAAPGVLAVLAGATHASFAGEAAAGPGWDDPTYQGRTATLSVLFLRAVLLHDVAAGALLSRGAPLAQGDRIETKGKLFPAQRLPASVAGP